jgi:hypothetical protein
MNARETLAQAAEWLAWQEESMSFGLRNAFDALRLYDYAQAHPELPEMADDWEETHFIAAIGYNPFSGMDHEAATSGADAAAEAMNMAHSLIDSVAYVATEGDKDKPLAALRDALGLH